MAAGATVVVVAEKAVVVTAAVGEAEVSTVAVAVAGAIVAAAVFGVAATAAAEWRVLRRVTAHLRVALLLTCADLPRSAQLPRELFLADDLHYQRPDHSLERMVVHLPVLF